MQALTDFVEWMAQYEFPDRNRRLPAGLRLNYHSRSDEHSKQLGRLIIRDLIESCEPMREHALRGGIAYSINYRHRWPNGKEKAIDLAVGVLATPVGAPENGLIHELVRTLPRRRQQGDNRFTRLLIACEEKAVMTEHSKSQPRIYSELNDSHTIVHQGSRDTIAAGITMVNVATTFVSPLRQRPDQPVIVTRHNQPSVTALMIQHLRGLPIRDTIDGVGLDAYCSFVVDVDNQGHVGLVTSPPAPQPDESDYFDTFLQRLCRFYAERFSSLDDLPDEGGLSIEDSLSSLAKEHPGLLESAAQYVVERGVEGAAELQAILQTIEFEVNSKRTEPDE
jgi:hypothetical protein